MMLRMPKASTGGTPATVALARAGVAFTVHSYEHDPGAASYGMEAAEVLGLPPEQVFKTLVAKGDKKGICLAMVPGDAQLDLKALARLTGDAKVETVPLKDVQPLTGYVRGGVTALACKKDYPVFCDETIELFDVISISAGQRGLQIFLAPADYLRATKGTTGPIARVSSRAR